MAPDRSLIVIAAGVAAALHVGKLPPALPVLTQALDLTLLQAGFLISLVQLAGMTLGLAVGLAADTLGLRRTMLAGLVVLAVAGVAGGWADSAGPLLALRAAEGLGVLLTAMPAPGLLRRLVPPQRLAPRLGLWGAYMPLGTASALLAGPWVIGLLGWQGWWWCTAAFAGAMALAVLLAVPADPRAPAQAAPATAPRLTAELATDWPQRLRETLGAPGPWLIALAFAMYSAQWLAVVGFLPSIYAQAGVSPARAGLATAVAAAVNMIGNIASGRLLQRGVAPERLLATGFGVMAAAGVLAFAPVWPAGGAGAAGPYVAVLVLSAVGGLIPGTLFSMAVRLAPSARSVSTTVGWMQQLSSLGQFAGPPLVAWVAARTGGWSWSWLVTASCALLGLLLAGRIGRLHARAAA